MIAVRRCKGKKGECALCLACAQEDAFIRGMAIRLYKPVLFLRWQLDKQDNESTLPSLFLKLYTLGYYWPILVGARKEICLYHLQIGWEPVSFFFSPLSCSLCSQNSLPSLQSLLDLIWVQPKLLEVQSSSCSSRSLETSLSPLKDPLEAGQVCWIANPRTGTFPQSRNSPFNVSAYLWKHILFS